MTRLTSLQPGISGTDKFGVVWFRLKNGAIVYHSDSFEVVSESVAYSIRVTPGPAFTLRVES